MRECRWIEPGHIRFYRESSGRLAAAWEGREEAVSAQRLFPLTDPDRAVRIEGEQAEWGTLRSLTGLDPQSRLVLEQELTDRSPLLRVLRIRTLRRRFERMEWETDTDQGTACFVTGPLYEALADLPGGARAVTDLLGQCYLLPADGGMDRGSRIRLARWW
jgi:hypothetical protein